MRSTTSRRARHRIRAGILATAALGLAPAAAQVAVAAPETVGLTILHTNDTHGHLLPFRYPARTAGPDGEGPPVDTELGGIARRATLVQRIRAELEPQGIAVWLVDAGDFMDGTAFSTEYQGRADLDAMGAAGYTLGVLGNHEMNQSLEALRRLVADVPFPLLCANVLDRATGTPLVRPSMIRKVGPVRVGVFSIVTTNAAGYPAAREGLVVEDEVASARRVASELRAQADIVILVSHGGRGLDARIAGEVAEIDVIVGGHSHSRLPTGELIWRAGTLSPEDVGGTIIVQAHQWGGELGRLDLLFGRADDERWRVVRHRANLIPVTAEIPDEPAVAAVVERYWGPIAAREEEVVGEAAGDFIARGDDRAEYNLMADAMRDALGTEVHLENLGGVRAPLSRGPVRRADLVAMDPFDNTLVTFSIAGRDLLRLLAEQAPAVSGLRYRLEGGKALDVYVGDALLDPARVYAVSTNSYFAGILAGAGIKGVDTGRKRLDTLIDYVRRQRTIRPLYDGRRVAGGGE